MTIGGGVRIKNGDLFGEEAADGRDIGVGVCG